MHTMRLAIMQPYFIPYLGYFQLMAAVDTFVLLDDVNYIKGGWINRNRILSNGQPTWLTIPLVKASPNKLICDTEIQPNNAWKTQMLRTLETAYRCAPYFDQSLAVFKDICNIDLTNVSHFLYRSLSILVRYLGINTELLPTSSVYPKGDLRGADRVLDICRRMNAGTYVNAPGGRHLYDTQDFHRLGVDLRFLNSVLPPYDQNISSFVPGLSIIDVMMWNAPTDIAAMIRQHSLS